MYAQLIFHVQNDSLTAAPELDCVPDVFDVTFRENETQPLLVYFRNAHNGHAFRASGSLLGYRGNNPAAEWAIQATDTVDDEHEGELLGWELSLTFGACYPTYSWTNITPTTGPSPSERYDHIALQVNNR